MTKSQNAIGNITHTPGQPCLYILYTHVVVRIVSNLQHWKFLNVLFARC